MLKMLNLNLVLDFDGTMADTFRPSPHEIGVSEAYCLALNHLFGRCGEKALLAAGGLQNRAPIELIAALRDQGLSVNSLEDVAEELVTAKLAVLLGEICPAWPLPCRGYAEFNTEIKRFRQDGHNIRLAILSSGHREFIEKTLCMWKTQWEGEVIWPDVIICDDDLRQLDMPMQDKIKPSPFLFTLIREQMSEENFIYFGDCPEKDGRLAVAAGVPFGWFATADNKKIPSPEVTNSLFAKFADWRDLPKLLCA